MAKLLDYLDKFIEEAVEQQFEPDQERWGDTWKHRPVEGQVDRMMARVQDYYDQYKFAGIPFPWFKVVGEMLIGWVRENDPDYAKE